MPYSGILDQFIFHDTTQGNWSAGSTNPADPTHPNLVTINYTTWTSTQITIAGFAGQSGGSWVVEPGDQVQVTIYGGLAQPNALTSASGTVPG